MQMPTAPDSKPPAGIPLRVILVAPFVALAVLTVALAGYLTFRNGQQAVNDVASQLRAELTTRIEEHLVTFLATPHQVNQVNANALRQGLLEANDANALERHFWEQVQIFDAATSIYFGNTTGGLVNAGREGHAGSLYVIATEGFASGPFRKYATDSQGKRTELLATVPDFDARTRPWYTGAVAKGRATWSEVFILFTGQDMAIAASRPVHDEQETLVGVVAVDLFLSHLGDFLQSLEIGKTGQAFIMERSGLLVAASTADKPFTEAEGEKTRRRLHAAESPSPLIRDAAGALAERFGGYHPIAGVQQMEFTIEGQRHFLQVLPVKNEHGLDWLIVVVIPEADFMAQINANNRATAFLVVAALAVAVSAGIIAAWRITRPLIQLKASAQALAQGRVSRPVRYEGRMREMSELAQSFNTMAGRLQQMLESLTAEVVERKHTERALRTSEERLELVLKGAGLGLWDWNVPTGDAVFNERWAEMLGYTLAEIEPKMTSWEALIHPDERAGVMAALNDHLEGHTPSYQTEHRLRAKSGEWRWILDIGKVLVRDEEGHPVRAAGMHQDVTERKHAEARLRWNESLLQMMADSSPLAFLVVDNRTDDILYFNRRFCEIWGIVHLDEAMRRGELKNNDIIPACLALLEDAPAFVESCKPLQDVANRVTLEDEIAFVEGRTIRRFSTQIRGAHDEYDGRFYIFEDITGRKQTEMALRKSEEFLSVIYKNSDIGIFVVAVSENGEYIYEGINPTHERLTGVENAVIIGKTPDDLLEYLGPESVDYVKTLYNQCVQERETVESEFHIPQGAAQGWWLSRLTPLIDEDTGQVVRLIGSGVVITERKRVEEALRESNHRLETAVAELKETRDRLVQQERVAAVGQLAAGIAHDFNNILTSMLGYAELLRVAPDMPEAARSGLEKIIIPGQRAAHLVRQILDFSRKSIRQPRRLNLGPFVKEVVTFLERTIPETVHLSLEIEPGDYLVEGDPAQIHQMLTNLVLNARDAMPAGGVLRVIVSRIEAQGEVGCVACNQAVEGDWIGVAVADTGGGIPPEVLPRIFEPFFTTKEVGQGSGLGLSQVTGIVQQHGGHIAVHSQVSQGTTFACYLPPVSVKQPEAELSDATPMQAGRGETILLVEDDPMVLAVMQSMLEHLGYRIVTATNGRDALAVYADQQDTITLVLSDIVMPDMEGLALFNVLRARNAEIRVVLMSGYPLGDSGAELLEQGVVDWFQKPLSLGELSQVISQALGR